MADTSYRWRVVDLVTAAVLGVAVGVIMVVWNQVGYSMFTALSFLPGLGGLVSGIWYMGGPLGGLIIRKPGAAIFVETLGAIVSMAIGSQWGLETMFAGLVQGAAAELVFAAFRYKKFGPAVAALSGGLAGLGAMIFEGFTHGYFARSFEFLAIYWTSSILSGTVLGGLLSWVLVKALAKTGVLSRFASGRDYAPRV